MGSASVTVHPDGSVEIEGDDEVTLMIEDSIFLAVACQGMHREFGFEPMTDEDLYDSAADIDIYSRVYRSEKSGNFIEIRWALVYDDLGDLLETYITEVLEVEPTTAIVYQRKI